MISRSEVGLIFAELGKTAGIFDNDIYAGIVMVIATTTILPLIYLKWHYKRLDRKLLTTKA